MIKNISRIVCCVLLLLGSSCKDAGCNTGLNLNTFRTTLSPTQTSPVTASIGCTYAEEGSCGLIVYNNGERLLAYDRCAPNAKSQLEVDGFLAVDSQTGAKWLLLDGSPSAIAECPLQQYQVQRLAELIVISN